MGRGCLAVETTQNTAAATATRLKARTTRFWIFDFGFSIANRTFFIFLLLGFVPYPARIDKLLSMFGEFIAGWRRLLHQPDAPARGLRLSWTG